jgi:BirA family transcriptional regulator, biotin operon repressor / biotin---[acetyl-CoA-carboxylase] ligase
MKESTFVKETTASLNKIDFVKKTFVFDVVDSTNATAKDLAKAGAEEGTLVIARTQRHGRGRFERNWESPEGGLYLSVILRPSTSSEKTSLLSFVAALAVARTISRYGTQATIKWPNDVRVNGRKIAGILLESEGDGQSIEYVVVGVGINLAIDLRALSAAIKAKSTSMLHELRHPVDYHEFLRTFVMVFEHYYESYQEQQYNDIINEWKTYSDTLGKNVRVKTKTDTLQGRAFDVDQSGFLLLRTTNGETKKILSGDCLYFDELDHA